MTNTMKFSDNDIRTLAECERMMDSGEMAFVMIEGMRSSISKEAMAYFGLQQGQTITNQIQIAIVEFNIKSLQQKIAERDTEKALAKAQFEIGKWRKK